MGKQIFQSSKHRWALLLVLLAVIPRWTLAATPLQNVQVTLKGEVFYISQVSTVEELQVRLEEESGLDPLEQGRVTFQGKVLDSADNLSEAGMKDGDQINIIPKKMADYWKMIRDMGDGLLNLRRRIHNKGMTIEGVSESEKKQVDVMTELFEDLTKVPYMQDEMERFVEHLKRPESLERATDPERVESMRQIILNNPMLMKYMAQSKTTQMAIQDPELWFRYVLVTVDQWKKMDGYQLWQRLLDGKLFGGD